MVAIPEQQLQTWCNPGAGATAILTHTSIRYALETANTSLVRGHSIEIFLQGSYRNATNIYSDSDVDVVVLLDETYTSDTSRLGAPQQHAERVAYRQAQYPCQQFRPDVLESLRRYYGAGSVIPGNKAIKVRGGTGRLAADVVPAVVHRLYTSYGITLATAGLSSHIEGISFWDQAGRHVVNYPKEHIKNGQGKNDLGRTNGNYKPIVRMFKNARVRMVEHGLLADGVSSSYFVECLLYNVPDQLFAANRQQAMRGVIEWLRDHDGTLFMCQNGVTFLFGPTPEQWNPTHAQQYVNELINLWNIW